MWLNVRMGLWSREENTRRCEFSTSGFKIAPCRTMLRDGRSSGQFSKLSNGKRTDVSDWLDFLAVGVATSVHLLSLAGLFSLYILLWLPASDKGEFDTQQAF